MNSSLWPKISIVTPSYNQASFLEATIQSVLSQDYPNLEYLVMDGGSTDGSQKILAKYHHRLRWVSQKDGGQADAINQGLRQVTGEIVGYLNSDDLLEPGALAVIATAFEDPEALWVTGQGRIVNEDGKPIRPFIEMYKNVWLRFYGFRALLITNFICQPATFWRRNVHNEIGYFDDQLEYAMDYDFWLRLNLITDPVILSDTLASFRIHRASKGERQYVLQFAEDFTITKRYTSEWLTLALHKLHNTCITTSYRLIKS